LGGGGDMKRGNGERKEIYKKERGKIKGKLKLKE
jgi:hypothetical protein